MGVPLCQAPVESHFEVGSHRILTVATARNPGSYIFGSSISSLKLSFDSKKISSQVETHSLEG